MKVSLSWLREFAPIDGEPAWLAEQLSDLGMAVEGLEAVGEGIEGVVVARVAALRPHPEADAIQLVDVDPGDGRTRQVCCGAFNMKAGDLVPLALPGTRLPGGLEIGRRRLRGQWSEGMLCSAAELGLGEDAAGIMVLDHVAEPGASLTEVLGIEPDVVFDLDITGNRPDAMSVAGVARDLAARLGVPFAIPEPVVAEAGSAAQGRAAVEILDPELCGRFLVRILDRVVVGPSPQWIQQRLRAVGQRPINNVVDASNLVMFELGQPNHTYDLDRVAGARLVIRRARDGETIETLDGVRRTLSASDGIIADGDDVPVGIAGVMGGASTEISETTSSVLLEVAWWDPIAIARAAKRLGLRSEASARFEKGADPEIAPLAARRFAEVLVPAGAVLAPGAVDAHGRLPARPVVRVRTRRVNEILGTDLSPEQVVATLAPIGFEAVRTGDDHDVWVPSWRPDSVTEVDVIEEVARHVGYSSIGRTVPLSPLVGGLSPRQQDRRRLRWALAGLGVDEVMPLPFLAPGDLERAGSRDRAVELANPLVAEESVMRTSLRPGLLKTLAYNASHRNLGLSIFEIGHVFAHPSEPGPLPEEREHLGVALGGREAPAAVEVWFALGEALGLADRRLVAAAPDGLHPTRAARLVVAGVDVGVVGEIDPEVAASFGVPERVGWLELDLDALFGLEHPERRYAPVSRYPSSDIDLAFEVDERCPAAEVEALLRSTAGPLLAGIALFDVFRGPPVGEGARSLAFALRLQAPDHTLTDEEVAEVRRRCIDGVESSLPARLRG